MEPMLKNWNISHKKYDFWLFLKIRSPGNLGSTLLHGHSRRSWEVALGADPWDRAGNLHTIPSIP